MNTDEALFERINKHAERTPDGCLIWRGATNNGCPLLRWKGKSQSVRKLVCESKAFTNLITSCGHPLCVEPTHVVPRFDVEARLLQLAGTTDRDLCWYVDRRKQPIINGTTARRIAFTRFIRETKHAALYTHCHVAGCFNPWHVIDLPEPGPDRHQDEIDMIEDCIGYILAGYPDVEEAYDQPTVDAARRRIKEEKL